MNSIDTNNIIEHAQCISPAHDSSMVFSLVRQVAVATPSSLSLATEIAGRKLTYLQQRKTMDKIPYSGKLSSEKTFVDWQV